MMTCWLTKSIIFTITRFHSKRILLRSPHSPSIQVWAQILKPSITFDWVVEHIHPPPQYEQNILVKAMRIQVLQILQDQDNYNIAWTQTNNLLANLRTWWRPSNQYSHHNNKYKDKDKTTRTNTNITRQGQRQDTKTNTRTHEHKKHKC